MRYLSQALLFCILTALLPKIAFSETAIQKSLEEFKADPDRSMEILPRKYDTSGVEMQVPHTSFSTSEIEQRTFVLRKKLARETILLNSHSEKPLEISSKHDISPEILSLFRSNDLVENLVDNPESLVRTPKEMEAKKLTSATLAETPWSDSYWPIYKGIIANRYADPQFPDSSYWKVNRDYTSSHSVPQILRNSPNSSSMDNLAPSEKYDLLVNTADFRLTQSMWNEGLRYFQATGTVETWMGICDGWAPAAYMMPRPTNSVIVPIAEDPRAKIRFFPSDLKALASLLWAKAHTEIKFVGGRCEERDPSTDEYGRTISQDCFDTNPGTWHLAVVNQLGASKRSLIMDATYDYEVWNQPIYSYEYTYFNPETLQETNRLDNALVKMQAFRNDRFRRYRNEQVRSVLGIAMNVTYMSETSPNHSVPDTSSRDKKVVVRYLYDLELADDGSIIGGEWYTHYHPDFLWTPKLNSQASSISDADIANDDWDGKSPFPASWSKAAARAAERSQPLSKLVNLLFVLSKLPASGP